MRKNNEVPERLSQLLEEHGITPMQLAERTEIPYTTVRAYINGRRDTISTRNLLLIAQTLEMPMAELMDILTGNSQNG